MANFTRKTWYDYNLNTPASAEHVNNLEERISDAFDLSASTTDIELLNQQISNIESSVSIAKYVHTQAFANNLWYIPHNFGTIPTSILIRDSENDEILGAIRVDMDNNNLTLQFSSPISGTAILQG